MKYFSLYSGIGGFDYPLRKLGHECIGYSEIDKYADWVYRYNYGLDVKNYGDATKLKPEDIPNFDILCAGFPCQAFSIAGKRRGFKDTRGTLFFEIARLLKVKRPKIILLENVKGLLNHQKGETFKIILQTLWKLGYTSLEWMVLNSKFFGVPQNRERVFIIGYLTRQGRQQVLPFREDAGEIQRISGKENIYDVYNKRFRTDGIAGTLKGEGISETSLGTAIPVKEELRMYDTAYKAHRANEIREHEGSPTLTQNMGTGGHNVPMVMNLQKRDINRPSIKKLTDAGLKPNAGSGTIGKEDEAYCLDAGCNQGVARYLDANIHKGILTRCLLVEPDYKTQYPNLALMKLSTHLKMQGYNIEYYKGKLDSETNYDYIFITTLFTYYYDKVVDTINYYKKKYPEAKIIVGGILASLLADKLEKDTGIIPVIGYIKKLDVVNPDYDILSLGDWENWSFIFTTRGCPNNCSFCAVNKLEAEPWIVPNWKDSVDLSKKHIMLMDNNITAFPIEHFRDVFEFIKEHKLKVKCEFDVNLFTDEHLEIIKDVKFPPRGLRFAFDSMRVDGNIQKVLKQCLDAGIKKSHILVYVLYNFYDTPLEANYRAREIINCGVSTYPQRYSPLDYLHKRPSYIGKYWTQPLARYFRYFYISTGIAKKITFVQWLKNGDMKDLVSDYYKYPWKKKGKKKIVAVRSFPRTGNKEKDGERFQNIEPQKEDYSNSLTNIQKDNLVGEYSHGKLRRLTPIECERLQGFPDNWTKYGIDYKDDKVVISDTQRYRQLGNAVTTKVTEELLRKIL